MMRGTPRAPRRWVYTACLFLLACVLAVTAGLLVGPERRRHRHRR